MSYLDLHLHLLPGVDDGARDDAAAIAYARRLAAEGVRDVTVTPHVNHYWPLEIATIPQRVDALATLLDEAGIGVRVRPGGELDARHARSLTDAELELIAQGPAGSRWLLLEAPFRGLDNEFADDFAALAGRGFGAVLAQRAGASSVQAWRLTQANPRFLLTHGIPRASSPATAAALELALD